MAELLGISVRHLHILFETTDVSFAQTVTAERLAESRRLLTQPREQSISEVALACGFNSLATFYRAFQAAHGMSPGSFRATQWTSERTDCNRNVRSGEVNRISGCQRRLSRQ